MVETEKFKYAIVYNAYKRLIKLLASFKRPINSIIQKLQSLIVEIDFKSMSHDALFWLIEATIEGLSANFATHHLFGARFGLATIIAHGIIIKQSLNIYSRIKKDGTTTKILKKNKQSSGKQ